MHHLCIREQYSVVLLDKVKCVLRKVFYLINRLCTYALNIRGGGFVLMRLWHKIKIYINKNLMSSTFF